MEQETKTKILTETNTAVILSVGMIAAFFIGLNMIFFMGSLTRRAVPAVPVSTIDKKMITDIDYATAQIDPTTMHDTDSLDRFFDIQGISDIGPLQFGKYNFNGIINFIDEQSSATPLPLAIQTSGGTHPAMLVTIHILGTTGNNPSIPADIEPFNKDGWDVLSSIFKINKAKAIEVDPNASSETFSICIPEKDSTDNPLGYNSPPDSKFGIKTASAIEIDPNQFMTTYYVDINGNTYYDMELTQRANTEDCNNFTNRALNFNDIYSGGMIPESPAEGLNYTLAKGWDTSLVLAGYSAVEGFVDINNDPLGVQSPLFLGGNAGSGEEGSFLIEAFILTLDTNEGLINLCFPETIDDSSFFYYFYDNNGTPYNDMLLTDEVECSTLPTNACDWVTTGYCDKYPLHECCVDVPEV